MNVDRTGKKEAVPAFRTEEEERRFWAAADSTQYVDWSSGMRWKPVGLTRSVRANSDTRFRADL